MRLLKVDSQDQLSLTKNLSKDIPSYAILSHTWSIDEEDEVTLNDLKDGSERKKLGFAKILSCAKQAHKDGLEYLWVDTCCIDKTNSTELDEAIRSMYNWYHEASKCYVFLSDVPPGDNSSDPGSKIFSSRWFRRGWTLQELLAPSNLQFYDQTWKFIGTKRGMSSEIEAATDIPQRFLRTVPVSEASVAQRMSWAAKRETTREEDMAYCLLGIFGVNMAVRYGEGLEEAFIRLQRKIIRNTEDDSILAWGFGPTKSTPSQLINVVSAGILATAPSNFVDCGHIVPRKSTHVTKFDFSRALIKADLSLHATSAGEMYGLLNCGPEQSTEQLVGIPLSKAVSGTSSDEYLRPQGRHPVLLAKTASAESTKAIYIMKRQDAAREAPSQQYWFHVEDNSIVTLTETYPPEDWKKNSAMIMKTSESNKNITRQCLARFRSHGGDFRDFLLVLELEMQGLKAHSHAMTLSKDTDLKELSQKLIYMRPEAFGKQSASNDKLNVEVSVVQKDGPRFAVKLTRPSNTPKVTVDATWELQHVDRKLKFVEMLQQEDEARFEAEKLSRQKDEKEATIDTMRGRLAKVNKDLKNLQAEQRRLEHELEKGGQEMERLTEKHKMASKQQVDLFEEEMETQRYIDEHETKQGLDNWLETTIKTQLATGKIRFHLKDTEVSDIDPPEISKAVETEKDIDRHAPLIWAAENGHKAVMQMLLEKGADIKVKNNGQSLPIIAAENGHETVMQLLLEKDPNVVARDGNTLLMIAAANGHKAVMQLLLEKGADMEARNHVNGTSLMIAAENGHEAVVQLLLKKGADIEAKDNHSETPLMVAAKNGHKAVVQLLLENEAFIEARENNGLTSLMIAVSQDHENVVQLLLEKGADIEPQANYSSKLLKWAIEKGHKTVVWLLLMKSAADIETWIDGDPLLATAAYNGQKAVVQLLLEEGADIEALNIHDSTSLMCAATNGQEAVVQLLLEKGANIKAQNRYNLTSLITAAANGHDTVVQLLLEKGADIEAKDKYGRTSLMIALENEHQTVVQLLLEKGAEFLADWNLCWKLIRWAIEKGHKAVMQLLLEKGINIEARDGHHTLLMIAAANGHEAVVQLLLEKGADIQAADSYGWTSLMLAAQNGQEAVVRLLMEKGADIKAKNNRNKTSLEIAAEEGQKAIMRLLLSADTDA